MKILSKLYLLTYFLILVIGCEKPDNNPDSKSIYLSNIDIVKSWEVVSVEGAPYNPKDTYSIWTFNKDNTYDWYFKFPGYYNLTGSGTYQVNENKLHLTGILPNKKIVNATIVLSVSRDKSQFSFLDTDGDKWVYRIADTEKDYSKNTSFFEQDSYTGNCQSRPTGTVCLKFSDDYIWFVNTLIGECDEVKHYYSNGKFVQVACGGKDYPYNNIEYHHILGSKQVKVVKR